MNVDNLKSLLIQYDQKRNYAIAQARNKKYEIYSKIPELEKIENDINTLSIKSIKSVLTTQNNKNAMIQDI